MNSFVALSLTYKTGISSLELERIISKDSYYSYNYAREIINGNFDLGELAISEKGNHSYLYAIEILKGRFELGEGVIIKNKYYSLYYLKNVMRYNHE